MAQVRSATQEVEDPARWKWFLALGAVLLCLGAAGIGRATLLEVTSLLVFGPLLLASSMIQFLTAIFAEKGKDRLLHYAAAGLEMVLGFFLMVHPLQGVVSLIAWIAIVLMAIGLARLARSLATQSRGRGWAVMAGVIALLLGIAVWIKWPVGELWFVGSCIAVDFICHGVSWSALALAERKLLQEGLT
jgi:membrane protein HdeD